MKKTMETLTIWSAVPEPAIASPTEPPKVREASVVKAARMPPSGRKNDRAPIKASTNTAAPAHSLKLRSRPGFISSTTTTAASQIPAGTTPMPRVPSAAPRAAAEP